MRRTRLLPLQLGGGRLPPALAARAGSTGRAGGGGAGRGGRARGLHVVGPFFPPGPVPKRDRARGEGRMPSPTLLEKGVLPLGATKLEIGKREGAAGSSISCAGTTEREAARQGQGGEVRSDPPQGG